ncbi:putative transcriptional regulator [Chryseobacterium soldanellicola]|uniref:Putative transcriptional regulator n=1 Tax=Chryseobacterium soldanellicola TaxID=311333 RepID=A0A1H1DFI5_9FLAO|nr:YqgE/AlgH family protein [Chryseobacterium soldanellicola]SDQ74958.1 putative transcriptional regulator [Chryseobacterium soldanellicola]
MNYSYKGKILISTPDISGDIFSRSVVLIIEHNESGAFGLILNKKNSQMSSKFKDFFDFKIEVYDGGPVENDKVFFIVKGKKKVTEVFSEINDEYYLTEDIENIISAVLNKEIDIHDVKIFSGYSGWTASQLDNEILSKMWTVVDVYNLDYTLPNDHTLWKSIMQNLGGEYLLWANSPEDISLN